MRNHFQVHSTFETRADGRVGSLRIIKVGGFDTRWRYNRDESEVVHSRSNKSLCQIVTMPGSGTEAIRVWCRLLLTRQRNQA